MGLWYMAGILDGLESHTMAIVWRDRRDRGRKRSKKKSCLSSYRTRLLHARPESAERVRAISTCLFGFATSRNVHRTTKSTDCYAFANGNMGCSTEFSGTGTIGEDFNRNGGGGYVLLKDAERGISIWFIPASNGSACLGIDPNWVVETTPDAYFPTGSNCDYRKHFTPHSFVFDTTFCVRRVGA